MFVLINSVNTVVTTGSWHEIRVMNRKLHIMKFIK